MCNNGESLQRQVSGSFTFLGTRKTTATEKSEFDCVLNLIGKVKLKASCRYLLSPLPETTSITICQLVYARTYRRKIFSRLVSIHEPFPPRQPLESIPIDKSRSQEIKKENDSGSSIWVRESSVRILHRRNIVPLQAVRGINKHTRWHQMCSHRKAFSQRQLRRT